MVVKDVKGMYTITVDESRRISYEEPTGMWSKDDYMRYHYEYANNIGTALGKKPWAKHVDLRNYKVSNITEEINLHTQWMVDNHMACAALIVDSAIVKMQMNRAVSGAFQQQAFTDLNEADAWLKSLGF